MYPDILDHNYELNTVKASVLHDIGKIKTPDAILLKPGRLTDEEFEVMKQHTVAGCEIIDRIIGNVEHEEYVDIARKIARYHHERWDGTGYPDGLSGRRFRYVQGSWHLLMFLMHYIRTGVIRKQSVPHLRCLKL